jgi:hypothetical protein
MAWLAKAAKARTAIARVGMTETGGAGGDDNGNSLAFAPASGGLALTDQSAPGFLARTRAKRQ